MEADLSIRFEDDCPYIKEVNRMVDNEDGKKKEWIHTQVARENPFSVTRFESDGKMSYVVQKGILRNGHFTNYSINVDPTNIGNFMKCVQDMYDDFGNFKPADEV